MRRRPDFIKYFMEWAGPSECPREYLRWAAISLLAAGCGRRVYTVRNIGYREVKIYPNLYMIFVGPSANFKSFSMGQAREVLDHVNYEDKMQIFDGHLTHSGLFDVMKDYKYVKDPETKKRTRQEFPWKRSLYLLHDELANDVGSIEYADLLIRALTRMYMGGSFDDQTRTHGRVHLENYIVNWFGCSTMEWFLSSLSRQALTAGFLRRTILVPQNYVNERIFKAEAPSNWSGLFDYLTKRLDEILTFGPEYPIVLNEGALRVAEAWYMDRPTPTTDDGTMSSWRHQYDLSLKLATILAISQHRTKINEDVLVEAQELAEQVVTWQKQLIPSILRGTRGANETTLLNIIRERGRTSRTVLMKAACNKFNMRSVELDQIVKTWIDAGLVKERRLPRSKGGVQYESKG